MKLALLLLTLILATAQANLGAYKNGKFIFPDTNKPYTGNLDVLNNDWGKDAVEFNRDYVDGIIQGTEKSYYQSGKLKSHLKHLKTPYIALLKHFYFTLKRYKVFKEVLCCGYVATFNLFSY